MEPMEQPSENEHATSFRDLVLPVWNRLWVVALVTAVVLGAAVGLTFVQTPLYEADIKVLVGQEQGQTPENLASQVPGLQQLTQTMTTAVVTRRVAGAVISELNLSMSPEDFLENLSVEQINSTQFIEIKYRDPSPERAKRIANTLGEVFSGQVSEVSPSANAVTATVWEKAAVPEEPASPSLLLNVLAGLVLGLMLGVALAFLLEYLDDSWRSPEEVEQISGVPTFGIIPVFEKPKSRKEA